MEFGKRMGGRGAADFSVTVSSSCSQSEDELGLSKRHLQVMKSLVGIAP